MPCANSHAACRPPKHERLPGRIPSCALDRKRQIHLSVRVADEKRAGIALPLSRVVSESSDEAVTLSHRPENWRKSSLLIQMW